MHLDVADIRGNIPNELSSFIGRERELQEISDLLQTHHVVTLTGTGGVGKTRLALRAAAREIHRFAGGVWLVELAALASPELVVETIAKVIAAPASGDTLPLDALSRFLRGHTFAGSTICYAFMQAVGMVNDHTVDCFRWKEVRELAL